MTGCAKRAEPAAVMSVEKVALKGYDPVGYFTSATAIKADAEHSCKHEGLSWYFVSNENLEAFKAQPQNYIPAFGGFCAYELAEGERVLSDPEQWHIHNQKLYFFEDEEAKNDWFTEIDEKIPEGEKQWKKLNTPREESTQQD